MSSSGIFGRVFGPCFRGWLQPIEQNTGNKYIDYAPNRKGKYDDKNLIRELTKDQVNSWDVMDLNEDDDFDGKIALSSKLQLHDNVFINPLDEDEHEKDISDDDGNNNKKKEEEPEIENQEEEIDPSHHQETEHTSTREFNEKDISVTDVSVTVESKDFVEDRNFTENEIIAKDDGDDDDNAKLVDDPEV